MGTIRSPRKGSLQFWPRVRSKKPYPTIRSWPNLKATKLLGFIGYKAGMTHITMIDQNQNSLNKNQPIFCPVTVIECPPLRALSLRFYKKTLDGSKVVSEIFSQNIPKELGRKIDLTKKPRKTKEPNLEEVDEVKLVIYTQPKLTGIGKKKPEILEVGLGGPDLKSKIEYGKSLLDKEIKLSEIFKEGQLLDVHAITKGKGFQGTVKRFGVAIRHHKSEKVKRGVGSLGPWTPKRVSFRVPQPGKMGYHTRTEYNKKTMKISNDPKEINPKGGFLHYGNIKNEYILIKGSIPGSSKRVIEMTEPIRAKDIPIQTPQITYISLESKQ